MSKYVAIKVKGLRPWLWFERSKTAEEGGTFRGDGGWGADGAHTSIVVALVDVTGRIESERLQYA